MYRFRKGPGSFRTAHYDPGNRYNRCGHNQEIFMPSTLFLGRPQAFLKA
jgi:hypothetical protein